MIANSDKGSLVWRFTKYQFDEGSRLLTVDGLSIGIESRPVELLLLLLRNAGEVVTKQEILQSVWPARIVSEASLTKCVARLRHCLGDAEQTLIQTLHGYGYRLAGPVSVHRNPPERQAVDPTTQMVTGAVIPGRANWHLVRRLGTGGYGDVWLGEQSRTGELRVFKFGLDGDQLTSLKREITLFRLLNSSIEDRGAFARVLDWSLEAAPYFVEVEWIAGGNLQAWVNERLTTGMLTLAARLELVAQIADALGAAHSMGVLHKDLKPGNVLVDSEGSRLPQVKLCDFGSGAALDFDRLQALGITRQGFTRAIGVEGRNSGTPLYLAPEVMAGGASSMRSDIYALGVILFQMVVGDFRRPLAPGWEGDVDEELLREDIALAAAGDPMRRMGSAAQLAANLRELERRKVDRSRQRLVMAEAEQTRQALERARARRGLWQVLAATLLVALAVASFLGLLAQRARREAYDHSLQAKAVTSFLINDILAATNPTIAGTHDARLLPLLDAASDKLQQRFAAQPIVLAELQSAMGQGYAALFETNKAEKLLTSAEDGLLRTLGNTDPETQNVRMALWYLYTANVDIEKIYAVSERIAAAEKAGGRSASSIGLKAGMMLAWIPCVAKAAAVMGLSDCSGMVRPFYLDALRRFGPDDLTTPEMAWYLGVALMYSSREDQAEPVLRGACAGLQQHYKADSYRLAECRRYLAAALDANGRSEEAVRLLTEVARNYETMLGLNGKFTALANKDLARSLIHAGDFARALTIARLAAESTLHQEEPDQAELLESQEVLADALVHAGQEGSGSSLAESALQRASDVFGPANPKTASLRATLAEARLRAGSAEQAEALLRENLRLGSDLPGRPEWYVGELDLSLARVLVAESQLREARALLTDALRLLNQGLGPQNHRTQLAASVLANLK